MFRLLFSTDVEKDLKKISGYYRNKILDEIEKQLLNKPTVPTRNRKLLINLVPPWDFSSVIWELRMDDYRIFYDVDEAKKELYIRVVRKKPRRRFYENDPNT